MRHTLDVMHIEKNVAATTFGFLMGESDTIAMRQDMVEAGAMPELHLRQEGDSQRLFKPHAPYVLREDEKVKLLKAIHSCKTPTGHCGNFEKLVNMEKKKLQFMKSHDWHVLIQDILPACIRGLLPEGPRVAIIRLGHCFKRLCAKVIRRRDLVLLHNYVAETVALLEVHFPPGFWNVMPHLLLHLPREVYWCGTVHTRWMYGVERHLGHLKGLIRNRARPEGSIAVGYQFEEALGFVSEHFDMYPGAARTIWSVEEDGRDSGEILEGKPQIKTWQTAELEELHEHIIRHSAVTSPYLQ